MLSRSETGSKNFIMGEGGGAGGIMGKQTSTATIPQLCKSDDTYTFDVNEKATALNE